MGNPYYKPTIIIHDVLIKHLVIDLYRMKESDGLFQVTNLNLSVSLYILVSLLTVLYVMSKTLHAVPINLQLGTSIVYFVLLLL